MYLIIAFKTPSPNWDKIANDVNSATALNSSKELKINSQWDENTYEIPYILYETNFIIVLHPFLETEDI